MVLNWDKVSSEPVSLREPAVLSQKLYHHMLNCSYNTLESGFMFRLKRPKTQPNQQSASVWSRRKEMSEQGLLDEHKSNEIATSSVVTKRLVSYLGFRMDGRF